MAAQDAAFEKIMELVGNDGPFQYRFNLIYNSVMVVFGGMSFMNIILAMNIPDHWCYVPGREYTNYTLEQWKFLTLPRYYMLFVKRQLNLFYMKVHFDIYIHYVYRPLS